MSASKRPSIGIDVDGVIADLNWSMKEQYKTMTGREMVTDDWHPNNGDGTRVRREELDAVFRTPGLWVGLRVYEGALGAIHRLKKIGDVFLHSAPPPNAPLYYSERLLWLRDNHLGDIPIVFTTDKSLVKADYFVDDRLTYIRQFGEENPTSRCFLVRRDWSFEGGVDQMRYRVRCAPVAWVDSLYEAAVHIEYYITGKLDKVWLSKFKPVGFEL